MNDYRYITDVVVLAAVALAAVLAGTLAPAKASGTPTVTVYLDQGRGGLAASPGAIRTTGLVAVVNGSGGDLHYAHSAGPSWPSAGGALLSSGASASVVVPGSGYVVFGTSPAGPSLAHTTVTKTDPK